VPELPEVETVRARIAPVLEGRLLERVEILDPRLVRPYEPAEVAAELEGERVAAVDRRGKYLIVRFDSGRALLVHLRMTGSFRVGLEAAAVEDPHRRASMVLDDGTEVGYRDVRRFGTWLLLEPEEVQPYLGAKVGEEPFDALFTVAHLSERLETRRAPIKAALLDQRTLAGLGNIYTDEALWWARIHPLRPAESLERNEVRRLHRAIRRALERGIARQGADLGDGVYRGGRMQQEFKVYGRADEPCDRCGTPIAKTRVGGRGTWFCPECQPQAASRSSSRPSRSRRQSSV
jgi:formamidopyrimidine-DNA glycosylase